MFSAIRNKIKFLLTGVALAFFLQPQLLKAQDLQSTLQLLSDQAAKAYLNPASNGFGADLNSGWFSRAPKPVKLGLDVQFGIVAMGAFLPEDNKTFSINGNFRFTPEQAALMTQSVANRYGQDAQQNLINQITSRDFNVLISGPTVIGSNNEYMKVNFYGTTLSYQAQAGQPAQEIYVPAQEIPIQEIKGVLDNIPLLPFGAPQLTLGTLYGTQVTFRYLPPTEISADLGKSDYFGFGIQHNIGVWIPLPLDVTLGYFTQRLKVGSTLKSRADEYGIFASKTFGPGIFSVTPYAGLTLQNSTMDVSYDYLYQSQGVEVPTHIAFQLEGENSGKLAIGLALRLSVINLNFDYNIAKFSSISGGLTFLF
ncbi:MAG: hypothetical protein HF300_08320 [Ignavibacteria bacterium]|jgi:hypothetical protein|nr:hypothetical protein [Ignavibacteria bacterium]MCU7499321.1 hypothetical protein [Ignavibacteria bacterium]MCU7512550.1 hypothetical protein [Ignavibacteria bacterium]MCU7519673.1 hypothetical protein [Ignavibacteria bacterium]MCU7524542.1 hypothetical protein [Ignavibacteria bacterium]